MVAPDEQFHRNGKWPQRGRRPRKDGFGRDGKTAAASEFYVNSLAGNYPKGGITGNIPNGTTDYIWQGWQAMEERNPFDGSGSTDTPIRQYIWGTYIDECIQLTTLTTLGPQNLPAGAYYLLQDLLYRAVALTNSSGNIVEAYDTDAYGNTLIFTAPDFSGNWWSDSVVQSSYSANEIIYCGYRFDPEGELYYVRNRTYSPIFGRWLQRDPIGYAGGINLYGYVGGRSEVAVDPDGLWHWWNPFSWPLWHSVPVKAATEAGKHAVGGSEFCGAAEASAPLANPAIFARARLNYDLTHEIDFAKDPLYQGLDAIAGGTPWQDLPPAEQQAVQNWSQNAAKSFW